MIQAKKCYQAVVFEQMGCTYRNENGYLIPNIALPTEEEN